MTQHELNRAVAAATGESVGLIAGIGFSLMETFEDDGDSENFRNPLVVDWDDVDLRRQAA